MRGSGSTAKLALVVVAATASITGCGKPSHDEIDKWVGTRKGPGKIESALGNSDLDADLRAHAAQALAIQLRKETRVIELLTAIDAKERQPILAKLAPRLWEDARLTDKMSRPSERQMLAKDVLYFLRPLADDGNRLVIDRYLVDWLTGGFFEGRAESGRVRGEVIIAAVGNKEEATAKLIEAINSEMVQSHKLGDNLLLALAATGTEAAVGKLLDMGSGDLPDKTLERRIFVHLYNAFVKPEDFAPADPRGLIPHIERFSAIMLDQGSSNEVVDIAINLVTAMGMPACLDPLVRMVSFPHSNKRFRWIGAKRALTCGGLAAATKVIGGLSAKGEHRQLDMDDAIWTRLVAMEPKSDVAKLARTLLTSDSWVARVSGIEVLDKLAIAATAKDDAALIAVLGSDKTPLKGWWGDQSEVPRKQRKATPTLGQRAREVTEHLEELAKTVQK